ncbi:MAG TPA: c-type cytochrome [Sulfurovum sp.]|uniref:c-type cytochrome n=1 Tax=Sulfurovum sp. TaxID=1969726 RepID=UPI002F947BED
MKRTTFFSLVAATLLFTACGEETKKASAEATASVTEAVKEDSAEAVEAAKAEASEVAEETEEKSEAIAAAAAEKAEAAKAAVASQVAETASAVEEKAEEVVAGTAPEMPAAYGKCVGCHGSDGKTKALGKSAVIAGQDKAALVTSMKEYQAGTKNVAGMGMLMKGQVATMSDEDIEAVAEYLSAIK